MKERNLMRHQPELEPTIQDRRMALLQAEENLNKTLKKFPDYNPFKESPMK